MNKILGLFLSRPILQRSDRFPLDSLFKQVCDKLDSHQFALAGKSATDALVFFIQVIFEALDQGDTYARILFTDFTKGFDLVDHNILIQEMELLGVHEATIR